MLTSVIAEAAATAGVVLAATALAAYGSTPTSSWRARDYIRPSSYQN